MSLYQAASALNANARWEDLITDNLAASSTPGFKRHDVSFSAVQSGLMPKTASGVQQYYTLPKATALTSFDAGELQPTGNKTDFALEGPGFFAVQMPNGATAYTRDGGFKVNLDGVLTTKQGFPVLGENGEIHLDRTKTDNITISETGEIAQRGESKGKLRIVNFSQPQLLTATSAGFFIAQHPSLFPEAVTQPNVRQGFIEASNTTPMAEMANLMTVMRGFEVNQRVMQVQDDRMGKAISELGNPS